MKFLPSVLIGTFIYLLLHYGELGIHYIYFYLTQDFGTSNILMIKSSLMQTFAILLGGSIAGYLSQRGFIAGFLVGSIAGMCILVIQQLTGANPLFQEYAPVNLFDGVFLKACICSAAGMAGELVKRKRQSAS